MSPESDHATVPVCALRVYTRVTAAHAVAEPPADGCELTVNDVDAAAAEQTNVTPAACLREMDCPAATVTTSNRRPSPSIMGCQLLTSGGRRRGTGCCRRSR